MGRRGRALLALVLVTFLAGCSGTGFGLTPDVVEATSEDDGTYRVTFGVTSDGDVTFHDVAVYGYTLTGERVCSGSLGNLSQETGTATTTCEAFPSLLVPDAREMDTGDFEEYDGLGYVEHHVTLYRGYNGSHRFTEFTTREEAAPRDGANTTRLVGESVLAAGKCRQWTDDGNYSILDDRPWFDWERQPPNTSSERFVTVVNATNTSEAAEAYVYSESAVTAPTEDAIETHRERNQSVTRVRLNETEFDDAVSAIRGRSGDDTTESGIKGSVERWNGTGVDCWAEPPQYDGSAGHEATVFVRYDGVVWKVTLRMRTEYSGPVRSANGSVATAGG